MKFAICNETFQDWPFEKAFSFARDLGYTGIEFAPFTIDKNVCRVTPEHRAKVRAQVESAGLTTIGLHWLLAFTNGLYLTSPQPEVRAATSEYLAELARFCRDLGGNIMVLGSPQQRNLLPGVTRKQAMEYAAEVIRGAITTLRECHVVLAVEPLGPDEGDFLVTISDGIELVEKINDPNVRLHLDVKAMSTENRSIADVIRDSAPYVAHFHANDPNRRGPGMGKVEFVPILRALREIDYQGWVSVEVFDYEPGSEALARESIDYLQKCLVQIE